MEQAVERARRLVAQRFPGAVAAFLGGSAATGDARPSSDLDVVVVLGDDLRDVAFVETLRFEGQLVEAFVYGPDAMQTWLAKGRRDRRPVVDRLVAEGRPLLGTADETALAAASRAAIAAGPAPLTAQERDLRRYALSALLDDLEDCAADDPGVTHAVAWGAWQAAAELALLTDRRWVGTGKWLVRELRREPDAFGLLAWAASPAVDVAALRDAVREVLAAAGGYHQEGMVRGERPPDL